jgi:hypothetical protein
MLSVECSERVFPFPTFRLVTSAATVGRFIGGALFITDWPESRWWAWARAYRCADRHDARGEVRLS